MADEKRSLEGRVEVPGVTGMIWLIGLLFTIGFAKLGMPQIIYAILLWPYYLGTALGGT